MPDKTLQVAQMLGISPSELTEESLTEFGKNRPNGHPIVCQRMAQLYLEQIVTENLSK